MYIISQNSSLQQALFKKKKNAFISIIYIIDFSIDSEYGLKRKKTKTCFKRSN